MVHLQPAQFPGGEAILSGAFSNKPDHSANQSNPEQSENAKRRGNRLLMVGRMRELALYRAQVLAQAGFTVLTATDLAEAVRIMQHSHFDAIVLSYTLPSREVEDLAEAARDYCPDCPIIAIAQSNTQDRRIAPDAVAIAEEGPPALLAALSQVLKPM